MFSPTTLISSNPVGSSKLAVWVVLATIVIVAVRYLVDHYFPGRLRRREATTLIPENVTLSAKTILTDAEAKFFHSLEQAVNGQYLVWPQLPLWTFIETRSNDRRSVTSFTNRINLKRIDFCLVDLQTRAIRMAIELDDRTHQQVKRQRRDALVEAVLKQVGVPLVRFSGARAYDVQIIRKQLGLDGVGRGNRKLAEAI